MDCLHLNCHGELNAIIPLVALAPLFVSRVRARAKLILSNLRARMRKESP